MERDWSLLHPDLLQAVAEKILSLIDYLHFRAVCHSWRSASSLRPLHLPPQLPWLMLPYQIDGNDDSPRLFYDLSQSKIHRLDLPETRGAEICGSSHGWLVLCKDIALTLLNPITRATIPLPSVSVPPANIGLAPRDWQGDEPFFEKWDADSDRYAIHTADYFSVVKVMLTSSPLDPSCLVFLFAFSFWQLAFCRIGDERWTVIEFKCNIHFDQIEDFTYSNGCLYTVDLPFKTVTVYDLNNCSRAILNCGFGQNPMYLVDGEHGDILFFCREGPTYVNGVLVKEIEYAVCKLSFDGEPQLIEVRDIGQNVLFVGGRFHTISFSSANMRMAEWGANCLFYDSISCDQNLPTFFNHKIILVRLDDGIVTDITGDLGSFRHNMDWQESLWLTPSLF